MKWFDVLRAAFVLYKPSKAKSSKCMSLIKQVKACINLQKKRMDAIVRQSRNDIVMILQNGQIEQAIARVDIYYKDQCLLASYDQIDHFCNCIITNISHIGKESRVENLPFELVEAMASLIFAASRCGQLPELHRLRNFFKKHYGCAFEIANVELSSANFVNLQLEQNLCTKALPEDEKLKIINNIALKYTLHLGYKESKETQQPILREEHAAHVVDLEMRDNCSDSHEINWVEASRVEKQRKAFARSRGSPLSSSAMRGDYEESLSTTATSDGLPRTSDISFVYLDDLREKSMNQTVSSTKYYSSKNTRVGSLVSPVTQFGDPFSERERSSTPRKKHHNVSAKDRRSVDTCTDKWKARKEKPGLSHVHPKLPNYEDLVVNLKSVRAGYNRKRGSFSYF